MYVPSLLGLVYVIWEIRELGTYLTAFIKLQVYILKVALRFAGNTSYSIV